MTLEHVTNEQVASGSGQFTEWKYRRIIFYDAQGNQVQSWQVRLADYVSQHAQARSLPEEAATRLHMHVVAQAIAREDPVVEVVWADHDAAQLREEVASLRCGAGDQEACRILRRLRGEKELPPMKGRLAPLRWLMEMEGDLHDELGK